MCACTSMLTKQDEWKAQALPPSGTTSVRAQSHTRLICEPVMQYVVIYHIHEFGWSRFRVTFVLMMPLPDRIFPAEKVILDDGRSKLFLENMPLVSIPPVFTDLQRR
jgi:hypothetical protein